MRLDTLLVCIAIALAAISPELILFLTDAPVRAQQMPEPALKRSDKIAPPPPTNFRVVEVREPAVHVSSFNEQLALSPHMFDGATIEAKAAQTVENPVMEGGVLVEGHSVGTLIFRQGEHSMRHRD